MNNELVKKLEALLFYKGEPVKKATLATLLDVPDTALSEAVQGLKQSLENRGITIVEDGDMIALGTGPEAQALIESMRKEELEGSLGKAGLETLAVVMYQQPVSRADIEYVRGVNCSSILRSLTMRGLIERKENPRDTRGYMYQTTPELPASLGITSLEEMPEYDAMRAKLEAIIRARDAEEQKESYDE